MNKKKSKNKPKVIKTIKPISNNNLFTEVQTNIDSVTIENNPSITSTEHILHPTNKYTCM